MLAEENKNSGPSALDGKLAEMFFLVSFCALSFCCPRIAFHSVSLLLNQFNAGMYT